MTITLLDGSIGQELIRRSPDPNTPLWSTQVLIDRPELVRAVHEDYFAAGATVATANSYAILEDRLAQVGIEDRIDDIARAAVDMARAARDAHGSGRVAGSIGPLIESYRPDLCPPAIDAAQIYAPAVARLKDSVDVLLFETMASVDQAEGALMAGQVADIPVWLSVTTDDHDGTRLRSGEPLTDLAPVIDRYTPDCLLINCTRPEVIADGLDILKSMGPPIGAYANGFTEVVEEFLEDNPDIDVLKARTDLATSTYADFAMGWIAQGATVVGGCCDIGPAYIAELARRLTAEGHSLV